MNSEFGMTKNQLNGNGNGRRPPTFFLFRNGKEDGPFSRLELDEMHQSGALPAAVPCRSRDDREWHDLGFTLRTSAPEVAPEVTAGVEAESTGSAISYPDVPREESFRTLMTTLVKNTQQQNQLLLTIKWSLFLLTGLLAVAGLIAWTAGS